jgi:hypothetical protein
VATLWAAYELIESWGVGFYLGGDTLPALDPQRRVKMVEAVFKPALAIRGSLPWCNFADSPTSWNPQDYRTFLEQMSRQKANFIGFHSYDQEPFASWFPNASTAAAGMPLMTATNKYQRHWSPPPWGAGTGLSELVRGSAGGAGGQKELPRSLFFPSSASPAVPCGASFINPARGRQQGLSFANKENPRIPKPVYTSSIQHIGPA